MRADEVSLSLSLSLSVCVRVCVCVCLSVCARLVAERPDDDARVVLVALHHAREPREEGEPPRGRLGEDALVAAREEAMRLDVCLN